MHLNLMDVTNLEICLPFLIDNFDKLKFELEFITTYIKTVNA